MTTQEQTFNTNLLNNDKGKCRKQVPVSENGNYVPNIGKHQECNMYGIRLSNRYRHAANKQRICWTKSSVADPDPGLGAFLTPESGMGEN